jgi:hypothetical protein
MQCSVKFIHYIAQKLTPHKTKVSIMTQRQQWTCYLQKKYVPNNYSRNIWVCHSKLTKPVYIWTATKWASIFRGAQKQHKSRKYTVCHEVLYYVAFHVSIHIFQLKAKPDKRHKGQSSRIVPHYSSLFSNHRYPYLTYVFRRYAMKSTWFELTAPACAFSSTPKNHKMSTIMTRD